MTLLPPRISDALWRIVPAPLQRRLRSTVVKRFIRFAPAAFCAVAATQITYIICLGPANLTAGVAGFAGWFAGAAVSYVISRWAWERKGRPQNRFPGITQRRYCPRPSVHTELRPGNAGLRLVDVKPDRTRGRLCAAALNLPPVAGHLRVGDGGGCWDGIWWPEAETVLG